MTKIVSDGLFNAATRYGITSTLIDNISDIAIMGSSNSVMVQDRLAYYLSNDIARAKVKQIRHGNYFTTEHRLEFYIATPDEFWEVVRSEAMKMSRNLYVGSRMRHSDSDT